MSQVIAFDTHRFVKNLTASGFTEAQAEALADEQAHLLDSNLATKTDFLAIKSDIREVRAEIREVKAEVRGVKSELESNIEQVRSDLEVKIEQVKGDLDVRLEQVKGELEMRIEGVRSEVQKAKADLLKWMVGALTAHAALIAGIVAGMFRFLG